MTVHRQHGAITTQDDRIEQALALHISDAMRRVAEQENVSMAEVLRVWRRMQSAVTTPKEQVMR